MADLSYTITHTLYCTAPREDLTLAQHLLLLLPFTLLMLTHSSVHSLDVSPPRNQTRFNPRRPLMSDRPAISARGARGGHYFGPHLRVFQPRLGPCQRPYTELSSESDTVTGAWQVLRVKVGPFGPASMSLLGSTSQSLCRENLILDIGRFGVLV